MAAGLVALAAFLLPYGTRAAVDNGVIRLAQPQSQPEGTEAEEEHAIPAAGRRAFDVEAFDGRFESLWFQRKAYQSGGRDDDAAKQSDLIRDFVSEEGVRRLQIPASSLLLEARALSREGSYDKALAALALAESLDPGRPQIALARAEVLSASGAGSFAAAAEWIGAARSALKIAARDRDTLNELALTVLVALLGATTIFAALIAARYHTMLRHDIEEWLIARDREWLAKPGGWAVLFLPLLLWVGAGWLVLYWLAAFFRYMRRGERALASALLVATALAVPAYRVAVGLYGLAADPTVRTMLAAANGGYDPDRIVKLRALVDEHPDDPVFRFLLAGLYKNGRYFEDGFKEYKHVLEVAPSTYQARINLGNIYFALGQYGQAISSYRQAIDVRSDSCLAYFDMYLAQSESFKLKEAADSLSKARELDRDQADRLLTVGSRDSGGAKVVDATIDFDSIWRATLEGGHARDWLDGGAAREGWTSAAAWLANPTSVLALATLCIGLASLAVFAGTTPARRCTRCGNAFCAHCKSSREGNDYCSQCLHLFVLKDGLAPETKSMKLYEVGRYETRVRRFRRLASVLVPGASQILTGRCVVGFLLVSVWMLVWIGGYPRILEPLEHLVGLEVHWAGLRAIPVPDVFRLDAMIVIAAPLGALVWLAGNVGGTSIGRA